MDQSRQFIPVYLKDDGHKFISQDLDLGYDTDEEATIAGQGNGIVGMIAGFTYTGTNIEVPMDENGKSSIEPSLAAQLGPWRVMVLSGPKLEESMALAGVEKELLVT